MSTYSGPLVTVALRKLTVVFHTKHCKYINEKKQTGFDHQQLFLNVILALLYYSVLRL